MHIADRPMTCARPQLAQATLDRIANAYVEAEGAAGRPAHPGRREDQVAGVGSKLSGTYAVGDVRTLAGGGYSRPASRSRGLAAHARWRHDAGQRPRPSATRWSIGVVTNNEDPETSAASG